MVWLIAQGIINGVLLGGVYAVVALGLTLIFRVKIINFAIGEFLMIGMYVVYFLSLSTGMIPYSFIFISVPVLFLFGILMYYILFRPIIKSGAPESNQILLTMGLQLFLTNIALYLFSSDVYRLSFSMSAINLEIFGVVIDLPRLIGLVGSLIIMALLYLVLYKTEIGRMIRAVSDDIEAAGICGIRVDWIYAIGFSIGIAVMGAAAPLLISFYPVTYNIGLTFTVISFIIVILGGIGSFYGAMVGGLIIGITQSLGAALLPGSIGQILVYLLFILFLLFKPSGLFGERRSGA